MTDDLVKRLREADDWYFDEPWERVTLVSDAPYKAADRIEAQAAEIERLRAALDWIANARQGYTYEAARDAARAALGDTQ